MCSKKEIEFLVLKQGNMNVVESAAKFEELVNFCPCYNGAAAEWSKCIKFESELRPEIKQGIGYQDIFQFHMLMNKCKIYDEDNRDRSTNYKSLSDKKGKSEHHGKTYSVPADKGKQRNSYENNLSGGEASASVKCFKCGELGHHANECKNNFLRLLKFRRTSHRIANCKSVGSTCYNYGEQGHMSINFQKPKKVQSGGKFFALIGLGLKLASMVGIMIVDTPALGPVTIFRQVDEFLKEETEVFMILASMNVEGKSLINELLVVCGFSKVFPYDISDLSPECEVNFAIDLVPGTILVSMDPYRMSASKLSELKKQLEELLEKKFVQPSVSP
ncbi:uncharacterized protein LOC127136927 [Lathyrus oleraceus]|uniref:uncharacterized protein LOC127136927 n=1 Tax=Pisum sativum TaxID=3888 RepID=UPI0021D08DE2|nr:uncharacterized protein LOC127136927 [Pisum sativum]